jgi:hypothetical protein
MHTSTGTFNFNINLLQPTLVASTGSTDIFLLKYDYEGTATNGWQYNSTLTESVWDIQMDAFGGLYMAGQSGTSSVRLGSNLTASSGHFLARLMTVRVSCWVVSQSVDCFYTSRQLTFLFRMQTTDHRTPACSPLW